MLARLVACALVLAACNPKDPGDSASEGTSTGAPATTTTTSQVPTESASPTGTSSTGDAEPTSSSSTGELESCSWRRPEFENFRFCPAPVELPVPITGTTPAGPITLRYALFGLQQCWICPTAEYPQILLSADPPDLELVEPTGDHISLTLWPHDDLGVGTWLGGMGVNKGDAEVALELPDVPDTDETSPPFDEAAPPLLPGTLTIQGDGWDLTASFEASLCSDLNWFIPCE
ncbi:hypothetical protein [Nannocystis radixulma]|uniref:Lipoprotein n=1 Tax=Nannocystis radixulma TaxID=2995305 RepID=A0ABT5B7A3_9BACT|nr:hypothetical protein [Nannocystis radixulma]MDC0669992.1 hypothetical protein [Nannocystis radixulma]